MKYYLGLDIGGTKIAGGIVSSTGEVLARLTAPTPVKAGGRQILVDAIGVAKELTSKSEFKIEAVGIGAGGQINSESGFVFSATDVLPGWKGLDIAGPMQSELKLTARVDNDVNALASGEARFGAAKKYSSGAVLFLALGTGVGGALLIDGAIHHGANWSGGEFGHILLTMDPAARCDLGGARGTLEAYCSGSGLVETWRDLGGDSDPAITGHDVMADALKNNDGIGSKAITRTGEYLGFGLVSLANALDPNIIIIGGGLADLQDRLLDPARAILASKALPGPAKCPVQTANLGVDAAVIGAASLVIGD